MLACLFFFRDSILEYVDNVLMIIAFLQLPEVFSCLEKFPLIKFCFLFRKSFDSTVQFMSMKLTFIPQFICLSKIVIRFWDFFSNEQTNKVEY